MHLSGEKEREWECWECLCVGRALVRVTSQSFPAGAATATATATTTAAAAAASLKLFRGSVNSFLKNR